jgi:orotate phosphoribosyltransferase
LKSAERILADAGAVLTNLHVVYKSGRHGVAYINKDELNPRSWDMDELGRKIALMFMDSDIEVVVAPAVGAIDLKSAVSRHLTSLCGRNVYGVYAEKVESPVVTLGSGEQPLSLAIIDPRYGEGDARHRRVVTLVPGNELLVRDENFHFKRDQAKFVKGKRALVVEDILTTGGTAKRTVWAARDVGGIVVAVAAICNRGGVTAADLDAPDLKAILNVVMDSYDEKDCPLCKNGVAITTEVGHGKAFLARQASNA